MKGINHLKTNCVNFTIMCIVNNRNVKDPENIYNWFISNNFNYIQFIPCVNIDLKSDTPDEQSITGEEWG